MTKGKATAVNGVSKTKGEGSIAMVVFLAAFTFCRKLDFKLHCYALRNSAVLSDLPGTYEFCMKRDSYWMSSHIK